MLVKGILHLLCFIPKVLGVGNERPCNAIGTRRSQNCATPSWRTLHAVPFVMLDLRLNTS